MSHEGMVTPEGVAWKDYETVFTNSKAGMDEVDKEHVKKVVFEMSKGSAHFKNEQRKEDAVRERISKMAQVRAGLAPAAVAASQRLADARVAVLEATRDLTRTWFHVDMDAFYASVEIRDDPSLATQPMGVGGMSMLSTANYVARRYGVRSAMPGFIAKKLCPELVLVRPNYKKYEEAAEVARSVFVEYDAHFTARGLDEASLDVTQTCKDREMTGLELAEELRRRVQERTRGLTCSVGIAPNKLLAKVCSDINKPNGQYQLVGEREAVMRFTSTLPVRKICGIGRVTEQVLASIGITTCGDLIERRGLVGALFSSISQEFFLTVGLGLGDSEPRSFAASNGPSAGRKCISVERTFKPLSKWPELKAKCTELAHSLAEDLRNEDLKGRTLTVKLKGVDFQVKTRAVTLPKHVCAVEDLLPPALKQLKAEMPISLRLLGLRLSNFLDAPACPGQAKLGSFFSKKSNSSDSGSDTSAPASPSDANREYFEAGSPGPSSRANSPFDILEHDNQTDDALGKRKFQNSDAGGSSLWNDSVTFPRLAPCGSSMYIDDSENLGTGSRDFADDTSHESTAIPLLSQVDPSSEAGTPPCARVAVPEGTTTQVNKERTLPAFQIQSSKPAVDQAADTDVQSNIIPLLSQVEPALEGNELPVSASDAAALGDGGGGEGGNGYLDIQSVDVREQERILQEIGWRQRHSDIGSGSTPPSGGTFATSRGRGSLVNKKNSARVSKGQDTSSRSNNKRQRTLLSGFLERQTSETVPLSQVRQQLCPECGVQVDRCQAYGMESARVRYGEKMKRPPLFAGLEEHMDYHLAMKLQVQQD